MSLSALSVLLGLISLAFTKRNKLSAVLFAVISLICISWVLYFIANYFSKNGLNLAALMHIKAVFNLNTVKLFYFEIILFLFTVTTLTYLIYKLYCLEHKYTNYLSEVFSHFVIMCSLSVAVFGFSTSSIGLNIRSIYYQYSITKQNKIDDYLFTVDFLAPPITYNKPSEKRNFIIIFAESLESSFFDNELFPNLTPRLRETINKHNSLRISNTNEVVMSNWTYGGMSAALCGLSYTPNYSINNPKRLSNPYIVGESCIGDILSQDDYQLSFTAGSDFGIEHKQKLLTNQGVQNFFTREKIKNSLKKDLPESKWGLYDDDLLSFSYERIKGLSRFKKPFGEIILTLDTHVPGLKTPSCNKLKYTDGKNSILNSVHCADRLLSDYIEKIYALPNSKNITVILLSDHLHPGSEPTIDSLERINRKNLFVVLNSPITDESLINIVNASQLDIAPTILHSLGYSIENFNLGRNVFNKPNSLPQQTLVNSLSHTRLNANIVPIRRKINSFWEKAIQ